MMKRRILMTAAAAMLAASLLLGGCGSRKADSPAYDGYEESDDTEEAARTVRPAKKERKK